MSVFGSYLEQRVQRVEIRKPTYDTLIVQGSVPQRTCLDCYYIISSLLNTVICGSAISYETRFYWAAMEYGVKTRKKSVKVFKLEKIGLIVIN